MNLFFYSGPSVAHKVNSTPLTTQSLVNVQLNTGHSNTGMRLASTLNKSTGIQLVEPYFKKKFAAAGQTLADFFTLSKSNFTMENGKQEKRSMVHCKNLQDLTSHVLHSRDYSPQHLVKLGIDGGGSFLKTSLRVISTEEVDESKSPQQKSSCLVTNSIARDTGVKLQLIVAIVEDLPETYATVKVMME